MDKIVSTFKLSLRRFLSFGVIIALIIGSLQLSWFVLSSSDQGRFILGKIISNLLSSSLNATVAVEVGEINLPYSATFLNSSIISRNDTVLKIPKISLSLKALSPISILRDAGIDSLQITKVSIHQPKIFIRRFKDSSLNVAPILSSLQDTSKPLFYISHTSINLLTTSNGTLLFQDEINPKKTIFTTRINFQSSIVKFNNASLFIKQRASNFQIKSDAFDYTISLSGNFEIEKAKHFSVKNLSVVLDGEKEIYGELSVKLPQLESINADEILELPLLFKLRSPNILPFLDDKKPAPFKLKAFVEAEGTLMNLNLRKANLNSFNSFIKGNCRLSSTLSNPKIENLVITNSEFFMKEFEDICMILGYDSTWHKIKPYVNFQKFTLNGNFHRLKDTKNKVNIDLNFFSSSGDFSLSGVSDFKTNEHDAEIFINNLDLSSIFHEKTLKSKLNFHGFFYNRYDSQNINSISFSSIIENSKIFNKSFYSPHFDAVLNNKQLSLSTNLNFEGTQLTTLCNIDISKTSPKYKFSGSFSSPDTKKFFDNDFFKKNINIFYDIKGDLNPVSEAGKLQISLYKDSLNLDTEITAYLEQNNQPEKTSRFEIFSKYLKMKGKGFFNVFSFPSFFKNSIASLKNEYDIAVSNNLNTGSLKLISYPFMDASLDIKLENNFSASSIFSSKLGGNFSLIANAKSSPSFLKLDVNAASESLTNPLFNLKNLELSLSYLDSIKTDQDLFNKTFFSSIKLKEINYQDLQFMLTDGEINYRNKVFSSNIRSFNGNVVSLIDLDFLAIPQPNGIKLIPNDISFSFRNFLWTLDKSLGIFISDNHIAIDTTCFTNIDQQIVICASVSDTIEPGKNMIYVEGNNISLTDLGEIITPNQLNMFNGTANFNVDLNQSFSGYYGSIDIGLDKFKYKSILLSDINYKGKLKDNLVFFNITGMFENPSFLKTSGPLSLSGKGQIPLNISYGNPMLLPEFPVYGSLTVKKFPLSFLKDFIPTDSIKGHASIEATLSGNISNISFDASADIQNGSFFMPSTGSLYFFNGDFSFSPTEIVINNLLFTDSQKGRASILGSIFLDEFSIDKYNISFDLDHFICLNRKDNRFSSFFGFFMATSKDLKLVGSYKKPLLKGNLLLDRMRLSTYNVSSSIQKEYSKSSQFVTVRPRGESKNSSNIDMHDHVNIYSLFSYYKKKKEIKASFIDKLKLDLNISSKNKLDYRLILNPTTGSELYASIDDISLTLKKDPDYTLTGYAKMHSGAFSFLSNKISLQENASIVWSSSPIQEGRFSNVIGTQTISRYNNTLNTTENIDIFVKVSDKIENPKLETAFSVSYANSTEKSYYKSPGSSFQGIPSKDTERNVFGLLLTRQWFKPPSISLSSNTGTTNNNISSAAVGAVSSILSNQISRIFNDISWIRYFNVGINSQATSNLGLDFSLKLSVPGFDERFSVSIENTTSSLEPSGVSNTRYTNKQQIEYKISPKFSVDAFHSNGENLGLASGASGEYVGLGLTYKESYRSLSELISKIGQIFKTEKRLSTTAKKE